MTKNKLLILITLMVSLLFLAGCSVDRVDGPTTIKESEVETVISEDAVDNYSETIADGGLVVHYIDVGQGDAIFIQLSSGENILIDAGDVDKGDIVLNYLRLHQVERIDFLIATHPHSDHIGGMTTIVDALEIGKVYMPKTTHTTQTYENLLLSIKNKGLKISEAKAGVKLDTDDLFTANFVAPLGSGYESINDYSAVLKLIYKNHSFLFTGDAEDVTGQEILGANTDIKAQVLDVPHHGSTNSIMSKDFLKAVSPQIAVISLGKDNRYGHPHQEVLHMLDEAGVRVYRTDIDGNIVIISDGNQLTINTSNQIINKNSPNEELVDSSNEFIGNKNSKVFHVPTCRNLPLEKNRQYFASKNKALDSDYRPCKECQP